MGISLTESQFTSLESAPKQGIQQILDGDQRAIIEAIEDNDFDNLIEELQSKGIELSRDLTILLQNTRTKIAKLHTENSIINDPQNLQNIIIVIDDTITAEIVLSWLNKQHQNRFTLESRKGFGGPTNIRVITQKTFEEMADKLRNQNIESIP